MDEEIELAEPSFIPLAPEEAAEAGRLLAALIRAISSPVPDSPVSPPESTFRRNLADGLPPAPRGRGKAGSSKGGGGRR